MRLYDGSEETVALWQSSRLAEEETMQKGSCSDGSEAVAWLCVVKALGGGDDAKRELLRRLGGGLSLALLLLRCNDGC
jgi:hypothetical protein